MKKLLSTKSSFRVGKLKLAEWNSEFKIPPHNNCLKLEWMFQVKNGCSNWGGC